MLPFSFPLWDSPAPGAKGQDVTDIPSITVYQPSPASKTGFRSNGAAMIVYPGGGYEALMDYEGEAYAKWLAGAGFTSFVVQYRLLPHGYYLSHIFADAVRAVRWVRSRAADYAIHPQKIGVIGSSAGGHLVANLVTHFDAGHTDAKDPVEQVSSRPDAGVLCYPLVHLPPRMKWAQQLIGKEDSSEMRRYFSGNLNVSKETSPCFLFHTVADQMVPVTESLRFAEALQRKKVPYELHLYQRGVHGVALGNGHPWTVECIRWLVELWGLD